ncbi:MAG: flagellar hook-basal body complex protein, partial [Planctomycetota bacterium]
LSDGSSSDVGQITLTNFVNREGLKSVGGNIYVETEASGAPIQGNPGEGSLGTILQGHLENSNVDPVNELVALIKTQRAFEMNSQTIQAADEVLQVVGNLRR